MHFHFHANQNHFHNNGFALRLALKQRHKGTRKWSIAYDGIFFQGALTKTETALRGPSEESATIIPGT